MKTKMIFTVLLLSGLAAVFSGCSQSGGKVTDVVVYKVIQSEPAVAELVVVDFNKESKKGSCTITIKSPSVNKSGTFEIKKKTDGSGKWTWTLKDSDNHTTNCEVGTDKKLKVDGLTATTYFFLLPDEMLPN